MAAGLALGLILPATASADKVLLDVAITGDSDLVSGTRASIYVSASDSFGLRHSRPAAGAEVAVSLVTLDKDRKPGATVANLGVVKTDGRGHAVVNFRVPPPQSDSHALKVRVRSRRGVREKLMPVAVTNRVGLHIRTDRGIYRPGSTLRWRISAIRSARASPSSSASSAL